MQRGLGGFPHERLHQDGKRQKIIKIILWWAVPKTNFQGYHRYDTYCPPYIN
ncbi:hypothetical protein [Moorena producens]|uniref:hypothetical protein n=1 Tax=Moorena producens TaxID=1155739 RepID=UPI003C715800